MPDREKVIKGLECCSVSGDNRDCDLCPIGFGEGCALKLKRAALAMLKAQEPVEPKKVNRYIDFDGEGNPYVPDTYDCGNCGNELPWKANYCPECGRKVKWE